MALRVDIQNKLISLFKVDSYEIVKYNAVTGLASVGHGTETPGVECNETTATIVTQEGQSTKNRLLNWTFVILCSFKNEVDFSDFILGLENMSYSYSNEIKVIITIGNNVNVQHPPRQGAHNGSELSFNITVNTRR
jgi:hypothetical protein